MGARRGGSQFLLTSQCASRKTTTTPRASRAPRVRDRMRPSLSSLRINLNSEERLGTKWEKLFTLNVLELWCNVNNFVVMESCKYVVICLFYFLVFLMRCNVLKLCCNVIVLIVLQCVVIFKIIFVCSKKLILILFQECVCIV